MAHFLLIALAALLLVVGGLYLYLSWHFDTWRRLGVPGPKPRLLFGSFPSALTGKQNLAYDFDEVYETYKRTHRAIGAFMTRNPEMLVLDPRLAHDVMVSDFGKYRANLAANWVVNKEADKYASRNPFFTVAEQWKTRRSDAMGGVSLSKLNLAYPIWLETTAKLSEYMKARCGAERSAIIETKNLTYRFTGAVVADFLWGLDGDTFNLETQSNGIIDKAAYMLSQSQATVVVYYMLGVAPFLRRYMNNRFFPAATDEFFSQLTKDAITLRLKDASKAGRADYLNYVLQLQEKKQQSHDDIMGYLLTALLDGFETSANIIAHTLFYLAKYEPVQERLRAEILSHATADGSSMSFETLNTLPYLDQCVHETIRIITPIPVFVRICTEATTLEVEAGKSVPIAPGTILNIPVFSFHHDADYFPEPWSYNPERFDNAAHHELIKQGTLMAFGDGPRICLGMRMGLLQVKSFLVGLLQEYRIKCCDRTQAEKRPDSNTFIFGLNGEFWLEYERL